MLWKTCIYIVVCKETQISMPAAALELLTKPWKLQVFSFRNPSFFIYLHNFEMYTYGKPLILFILVKLIFLVPLLVYVSFIQIQASNHVVLVNLILYSYIWTTQTQTHPDFDHYTPMGNP